MTNANVRRPMSGRTDDLCRLQVYIDGVLKARPIFLVSDLGKDKLRGRGAQVSADLTPGQWRAEGAADRSRARWPSGDGAAGPAAGRDSRSAPVACATSCAHPGRAVCARRGLTASMALERLCEPGRARCHQAPAGWEHSCGRHRANFGRSRARCGRARAKFGPLRPCFPNLAKFGPTLVEVHLPGDKFARHWSNWVQNVSVAGRVRSKLSDV